VRDRAHRLSAYLSTFSRGHNGRVYRRSADQDGDGSVPRVSPLPAVAPQLPPTPDLFDPEELRELSGYARLAELLKQAHCALRGMDLDLPERADFVRRLLVITAASRHDQDEAMRRLQRFLRSVQEKRRLSP
jgi:hypothetical protein